MVGHTEGGQPIGLLLELEGGALGSIGEQPHAQQALQNAHHQGYQAYRPLPVQKQQNPGRR